MVTSAVRFALPVQVAFVVVAGIGVFGFVSAAKEGERRRLCTPFCVVQPNYAANNRLAPDFELPRLGGGTVKLSAYRGKVVVLNFWTKTCRPCLEEMPSLAELAQIARGRKDMVVLTISTDETEQDARDTLRSVLGGEAPFVTGLDPDSKIVAGKFGTKLYPETWFIDPRGVIRARVDGARDWSNPLALELVEAIGGSLTCSDLVEPGPNGAEIVRAVPLGGLRAVCEEAGYAG